MLFRSEIDAGNTLVIRGASGAGKTTIAMGLLGLIRYSGSLTIGGVEVREIENLDELVTGALQNGHIFNTSLRENLKNWKEIFPLDKPVISTLKGIEASTCHRMTEILEEELAIPAENVGIITGPNLAGELILRQPAGAVGASKNSVLAALIVELFTTHYFRVYPSHDLVGCELAGASKSVIALAVGMAVGLGLGENTQSMIITRGLTEVARFGSAYGAEPLTNLGLAGMGDLVASCGSPLSRNRTFGEAIGRAGTMAEAARNAKTVEGVASANAILELAHRVGVEVPIIEAVADVVGGKLDASSAIDRLMSV